MTEIQYLHRAEQVDAHRRDFLIFWESYLLPELRRMNVSELTIAQAKLDRWRGWLANDKSRARPTTKPKP